MLAAAVPVLKFAACCKLSVACLLSESLHLLEDISGRFFFAYTFVF